MTERNPDGTFANGNNANPEGKNGHLKGWQRYGERLQGWLDKPGDEIARIVANTEERNKLSSIDIACIRHAAEIIGGIDWLNALEKGLDRIEGKPKQTHAHGGDPDNLTPISHDGHFTLKFGTEGNDDDGLDDTNGSDTPKDADVG